jgi:hypothetical protein
LPRSKNEPVTLAILPFPCLQPSIVIRHKPR